MKCDFLLVERMELHTNYLLLYKGFCSLHRLNKDHLVKKGNIFRLNLLNLLILKIKSLTTTKISSYCSIFEAKTEIAVAS